MQTKTTNQKRLSNGQYGKVKSKVIPFTVFLIIIGLVITVAINEYRNAPGTPEIAPESAVQQDSELQSIMDEEGFRKAMELKARKIKIERAKTEEIARHEAAMKDIESQLEEVRKSELNTDSLE